MPVLPSPVLLQFPVEPVGIPTINAENYGNVAITPELFFGQPLKITSGFFMFFMLPIEY